MLLSDAVAAHVRAGMHLNFASTPARSNAAIREVARQFRTSDPGFTFSATGFHSTAHLLGMLRLGNRYIGCFFGDNYPHPRPNPLYGRLAEEGARLEHWSLLTYVCALRAAALDHPYAVTTSLRGTTLGQELAASGSYFQVPDPAVPGETIGLVAPLRPDLTFVHAAAATADGDVVSYPPFAEGFWGAMAARHGVIVTVEQIIGTDRLRSLGGPVALPAHRVLAVCEVPRGAHPQPVFTPRGTGLPSYPDDGAHYLLWRRMASEPALFDRYAEAVLDPSGDPAFDTGAAPPRGRALSPSVAERTILRAAAVIAERVRAQGYRTLLAGIGQSFLAARLARLRLAAEGVQVAVMVETGMYDVECGPDADGFLLAHRNIERARRLSSVEDILGSLVCGADSGRCLAVVGAAQIDPTGAINSTRLAGGRQLVGSGGAGDIMARAAETVVVTACDPARLVEAVDYVTSPGHAVRWIVTDLCTFSRDDTRSTAWTACAIETPADADRVDLACPWPGLAVDARAPASPVTEEDLAELRRLDHQAFYRS